MATSPPNAISTLGHNAAEGAGSLKKSAKTYAPRLRLPASRYETPTGSVSRKR
jgi:hypothetical protein